MECEGVVWTSTNYQITKSLIVMFNMGMMMMVGAMLKLLCRHTLHISCK